MAYLLAGFAWLMPYFLEIFSLCLRLVADLFATSRNLKVANKSRLSQFATLKTRRKLGRGSFRKDFWDRYWGRAIQLLANLFALPP